MICRVIWVEEVFKKTEFASLGIIVIDNIWKSSSSFSSLLCKKGPIYQSNSSSFAMTVANADWLVLFLILLGGEKVK
jgi:hypothetical protein